MENNKEIKKLSYKLYDRHSSDEMNEVKALFRDFDFEKFIPIIEAETFVELIELIDLIQENENIIQIELYITGLTPAYTWLCEFLQRMKFKGVLVPLHFNNKNLIYQKCGELNFGGFEK
jgi:hypothetical protein